MKINVEEWKKLMETPEFKKTVFGFTKYNYSIADEFHKLELLQEMENFLANFQGREPAKVSWAKYTNNSYVYTNKNQIYILQRNQGDRLYYDLAALIHEGAHIFVEKNQNNQSVFTESQIEVLKYNFYKSVYDSSFSSYLRYGKNTEIEYFAYRNQPQEYFADKMAILIGSEIMKFLSKYDNYDYYTDYVKNRVDVLENSFDWYSDEKYEKEVLDVHKKLTDDSRKLYALENSIYIKHLETDNEIIKKYNDGSYDKQELENYYEFFFPTVWNRLNEKQRLDIVSNFFNRIDLKLLPQNFIRSSGETVLEDILRERLNSYENEYVIKGITHGIYDIIDKDFDDQDLLNAYKEYLNPGFKFNFGSFKNFRSDGYEIFFDKECKILKDHFIQPLKDQYEYIQKKYGHDTYSLINRFTLHKQLVEKFQEIVDRSKKVVRKYKEDQYTKRSR